MAITAGDQATAADVNAELDKIKRIWKTADETVNNSIAVQDDNHLSFSIAANEIWEFRIVLIHIGNATADLKVAVT